MNNDIKKKKSEHNLQQPMTNTTQIKKPTIMSVTLTNIINHVPFPSVYEELCEVYVEKLTV